MPTNVIVTHADGTQNIYLNCMAGISNNQGNGWKLSVIPTDSSQSPFVVDLRSGDTYQDSGNLPTAPAYSAPAQAAWTAPSASTPAAAVVLADVVPPGTVNTLVAPPSTPDPIL